MKFSKVMHVIDGVAVLIGCLLVIVCAANLAQAEAAQGALISPSLGHPAFLFLGVTLASFPVSRRVIYNALLDPANTAECNDVGEALCRVGLQQRVHAANLYMADLTDDSLQRAFNGTEAMMDWMRPACSDAKLRRQLDPSLLSRLEKLAADRGDDAWPQA